MLGYLLHTPVRKQYYGAPQLLICCLDLSMVSSVLYLKSYLTSVQTVKYRDPSMGSSHILLHLVLLAETSLTLEYPLITQAFPPPAHLWWPSLHLQQIPCECRWTQLSRWHSKEPCTRALNLPSLCWSVWHVIHARTYVSRISVAHSHAVTD